MQIFRHLTVNNITFKPDEFKREIHLQGFLVSNEEVLSLGEEPYIDPTVLDEEFVSVRKQSRSGKGRIDLVVQYSENNIGIVEIKKVQLNELHLSQLKDYLSDIDVTKFKVDPDPITEKPELVGILVGPSIEPELSRKIKEGLKTSEGIPIAALIVERFASHLDSFVVTTPHFKLPSGRDYTKYIFEGVKYGKAPLVRAVVQKHVDTDSAKDLSQLYDHFPKELQGYYGVFATYEEAKTVNDQYGYVRYYTKLDEVRRLSDNNAIAICSQWGKGNIEGFLKRAGELGYSIEKAN
jgi:hypothetical protein